MATHLEKLSTPGRKDIPVEAGEEFGILDRVLRFLGLAGAIIPTAAVLFIAAVLLVSALPSILFNGLGFLYHQSWNFGNFYSSATVTHNGIQAPTGASYGALPIIIGTLLTSIIAFVIGVPIAVGSALILVEKVPPPLRRTLSFFLELLAGIPSVVYGLWGLIVLGPFLAGHIYPILARLGAIIPWLGPPVGSGLGLLTAGLILAVMIIPIVASTTRDLLSQVPVLPREGAVALGLTSWESVRLVSLPWVFSGIVGASILGWGRALGETMAVLIVSGNGANFLPQNIYSPVSTIAATIVALLDSAESDPTGLAVSALAEAGLILMLITLATNILARLMVRRVSSTSLPIGRGV
ncbi:MAG: phosphate ABC transporter permease subunit PstC [Chloroflexi bacterium]|nr:phosphate ABC transporter permease subunit PstC [Chloroflexota bacterium]